MWVCVCVSERRTEFKCVCVCVGVREKENHRKINSTWPYPTRLGNQTPALCWWPGSAVTHWTGIAAKPGSTRAVLPDEWDLACRVLKSILKVHRCATNNACRAEWGQYPLIIKIQKSAIKFWKHLKSSDPHSYHYKDLQYQETCPLHALPFACSPVTSTGCVHSLACDSTQWPFSFPVLVSLIPDASRWA